MAARWLVPDAPAGVAILRLPADPRLLDRPWPEPGAARLAWLIDAAGTPVDQVIALRLDGGEGELHTHGGAGMRAAVTAALAGHGVGPVAEAGADGDAAWDVLAACRHPAAVAALLAGTATPAQRRWAAAEPLVLITGPANAGKSSLLNAWCGYDRALVADAPGTTRDLVAATILVDGWRLRVADSAGLRPDGDALEQAGQALAVAARAQAAAVIALHPPDDDGAWIQPGDVVVAGKADLAGAAGHALRWSDRLPGREAMLGAIGGAVLGAIGVR